MKGEIEEMRKFLRKVIAKVRRIAREASTEIESSLGPLKSLTGEDRDYALDEIQQEAEQSDAFLDLVSEIMAEIQARFEQITSGEFERTSTRWPMAWTLSLSADHRPEFMVALRWLSGNAKRQWGRLLTPLVTGIRVRGPFRPNWAPADYQHVFIDTEGLSHSKASSDVPNELTSLFKSVDTILLVESATNALIRQQEPKSSRRCPALATPRSLRLRSPTWILPRTRT